MPTLANGPEPYFDPSPPHESQAVRDHRVQREHEQRLASGYKALRQYEEHNLKLAQTQADPAWSRYRRFEVR